MRTYMAKLGDFMFSLDTAAFQELDRQSQYRWQGIERVGRKPAQQFLGPSADTISLSGVILPTFRGGIGQIGAMRSLANTGTPLPLIYGFDTVGQYCGKWCITAVTEKRTVFFDNGSPRKIEFSLSLVEYGEDVDAAAVVQAIAQASAASVTTVDVQVTVANAQAVGAEASKVESQSGAFAMLGKVMAAGNEVASDIQIAVSDVLNSDAVKLVRTGITEMQNLKAQVVAVKGAVDAMRNIGNDPMQAFSTLGSVAATSSTLSDSLGSASRKLGLTGQDYNGGSSGSLHQSQITSSTSTLSSLATAADEMRTTASTLKTFFA